MIGVPEEVVDTVTRLRGVVTDIVMVGGWAVHCRLAMGRSRSRPTSDLDVILGPDSRPARAALEAIAAVQDDPGHPCRVSGLPLLVDLLSAEGDAAREVVVDEDGLALLIPPFASLLERTAESIVLEAGGARTDCSLPTAGALLAAKVGNLALEHRTPDKRASDGEDAVRLLETFGALALAADLAAATPAESGLLARVLGQVGASGLEAQARASGYRPDPGRAPAAVAALLARLPAS